MRYHQVMLSFDDCNAARLRRDPRYDGRFFTAVKTTGIYCRPVCPAKQPLHAQRRLLPDGGRGRSVGVPALPALPPRNRAALPGLNGTRSTVARAVKLDQRGRAR